MTQLLESSIWSHRWPETTCMYKECSHFFKSCPWMLKYKLTDSYIHNLHPLYNSFHMLNFTCLFQLFIFFNFCFFYLDWDWCEWSTHFLQGRAPPFWSRSLHCLICDYRQRLFLSIVMMTKLYEMSQPLRQYVTSGWPLPCVWLQREWPEAEVFDPHDSYLCTACCVYISVSIDHYCSRVQ